MNRISKFIIAFIVGFVVVGAASSAFASEVTIISIKDKYYTKENYVDTPQTSCNEVDVPIYQQNKSDGNLGDFLAGAIIGGAIGNQIGDSKGNGALGAIIGGAIANESAKKKNSTSTIIGYKRENVCTTTTVRTKNIQRVYNGTVMSFVYQDKQYTVRFNK